MVAFGGITTSDMDHSYIDFMNMALKNFQHWKQLVGSLDVASGTF